MELGEVEGFWSTVQTATASTSHVFECWESSLATDTGENQSAMPCDNDVIRSDWVRPIGLRHLEFHARTNCLTDFFLWNNQGYLCSGNAETKHTLFICIHYWHWNSLKLVENQGLQYSRKQVTWHTQDCLKGSRTAFVFYFVLRSTYNALKIFASKNIIM